MYRDAEQVLRERARDIAERAARQRAELSPEDVAALPEALQQELAGLDARLACDELSPAAIASAEDALAEQARLFAAVRKLLGERHRSTRRERHDRALALGKLERWRRRRWIALAVLVATSLVVIRVRDAVCRRSAACWRRGDCSAGWDLSCVAGSEGDCAQSEACRTRGACSRSGPACAPLRDLDCAQSAACRERGLCAALDRHCVAFTDADCARSEACRSDNRCVASLNVCVRGLLPP